MARLEKELDTLKALGITNLRVLAGGDGPNGVFSRIEPTLQVNPGIYNDTLLAGLDRFLVELGKRDMQAVIYMNNSWEWSGGYGQYLEWATGEKALLPLVDGYGPYVQQVCGFQTNEAAQQLYFNHVKNLVGRINSITGKAYKDDPAIFAWQLCNEPRCFSDEEGAREGFIGWMTTAAGIVKKLDPNHLLSTGSEGLIGCGLDSVLLRRVNEIPGIDYMTIHIWPYNWDWTKAESLEEDMPAVLAKTEEYIKSHAELAYELGLPLVCEEFGYPRDGFSSESSASTHARDEYYGYVLSQVGTLLQGANFWGWSGFAEPLHRQWESGDPYTGDPAQEPQGLYGVYASDTTVEIIKSTSNVRTGDLLFIGIPADYSITDDDMAGAISASTGSGELNIIHVAILEVSEGQTYIIDATLAHGVDRHPLDTMKADFTLKDGSLPEFIVMRMKDNARAEEWIAKAKTFCGQPYDVAFLPDNGAMYCSELVRESYLGPKGEYLFPDAPMNFLNAEGEMPVYWTQLFAILGMDVPQGEPGTNPAAMSGSKLLERINCKL